MLFTLEALRAKKGDSLVLHYGDNDDPRLIVIDGGPSHVYEDSLRPRLETLRDDRVPNAALPIRMLMVSHIDDDHIHGVLDLVAELQTLKEDREPRPFEIEILWHNSFDDLVGGKSEVLESSVRSEVGEASLAGGNVSPELVRRHDSALVLASVRQGRNLRLHAEALALPVNRPFDGLVVADGDAPPLEIGDGLRFRVLGPSRQRVLDLEQEWNDYLEEKGLAQAEAGQVEALSFSDRSVFNLASIVVMAEVEDKRMLLTGDARGDDVFEGLEAAGLFDAEGKIHVDLLKMPHHGSDRNVTTGFFRRVTADHYVISGDGEHGNPELETFRMLFAARQDDPRPFTLHLTYEPEDYTDDRGTPYPVAELRELFAAQRAAGREFTVVAPAAGKSFVRVDLLEEYGGA